MIPSMDYYDHHPLLTLPRPACLVGFYGSQADTVARLVSARTGLPLSVLDRWVEHETGKSCSQLALQEGSEALARAQAHQLGRALSRAPAGLVVLSATMLSHADVLARVLQHATLVYIERDPPFLLENLQRDWEQDRANHPPFVYAPPSTLQDLQDLLAPHLPFYEAAHLTLRGGRRSVHAIAVELLAWLRRSTAH